MFPNDITPYRATWTEFLGGTGHAFLQSQTELLRSQLSEALTALRDAKSRYGLVTIEGQQSILNGQLGSIGDQISRIEAELASSEAKAMELKNSVDSLPSTVVTESVNGALNADKVFHVGALSPLCRSSIVILFLLLFHEQWGIYSVAWGFLLGELVRLLVSLRAFIRRGHRLELTWTLDNASTAFFASAAYQMVGFGLLCFIPSINHVTASWLEPGDLSIMSYALQLRNVPSLLLTAGLGTVVLSHWADHYSNSSARFSWPYVGRVFGTLFLIAAACAGCLIVLQRPIAFIALGWGAFPHEKLPLVAQLFGLFLLSLPFDVATLLCVRILIIVKADAMYMCLSLLKVLCLIALNCLMVRTYGLFRTPAGRFSKAYNPKSAGRVPAVNEYGGISDVC